MRSASLYSLTTAIWMGTVISLSQAAAVTSGASQRIAEKYQVLRQNYYSPAVAKKDRELAAVAALVILPGGTAAQLSRQITAALNAGATREELVDGLVAVSAAVGDVRSFEALRIASDVLDARDEINPREPPVLEAADGEEALLGSAKVLKNRELFVVCAYLSSSTVGTPVATQVETALRVGWTKQQLGEIVGYLALYGGIPNAMSALNVVDQAVEGSHDFAPAEASYFNMARTASPAAADVTKGMANLQRLNPEDLDQGDGWSSSEASAPGLYRLGIGYLYGDLLKRPPLDDRTKLIAIISAMTARGGTPEQLAFHIETALNGGVSRQEIIATIELMSAIGGFDNAMTAATVADDVFRRRDVTRKSDKAWFSRCYRRRPPCPAPK